MPSSAASLRQIQCVDLSFGFLRVAMAALLIAGSFTGAAQPAANGAPLLLRNPSVNKTSIAFLYADDVWTVPRSGGEATRLTATSVKGGVKRNHWGGVRGSQWRIASGYFGEEGWSDSFSAALLESVGVGVHLQDVDMVGDAVEPGAGQPFRAEDLCPSSEGRLRGAHLGSGRCGQLAMSSLGGLRSMWHRTRCRTASELIVFSPSACSMAAVTSASGKVSSSRRAWMYSRAACFGSRASSNRRR